jgi:hypothetical protein
MSIETLDDIDNLLTNAIHDALRSNLTNFYRSTRGNINYIVNEELYFLQDRDDFSSTLLLDIVTRFGSPGNDNLHEHMKKQRRKQINNLGKYKKVKEELELECPICLENFKQNEYYRKLDCDHCFHKKCIDRWFKKDHSECPMCRKKIL